MALNGGKGTLQHGLVPKQLVHSQRQQGEEQIKAWEREIKAKMEGNQMNVFRLLRQSHSSQISCIRKQNSGPCQRVM